MTPIPVRVQSVARPADPDTPEGDEALGTFLRDALVRSVERGAGGPVAVVGRERRVDLVPLEPLARAFRIEQLLAGLSRSATHEGPARLVGLMGRFVHRTRGPVALVFLEWPDCRWWGWWTPLDPRGRPVPDADLLRRAVDGDPLPDGLGRWWTLGRRTGIRVQFGPPVIPAGDEAVVH